MKTKKLINVDNNNYNLFAALCKIKHQKVGDRLDKIIKQDLVKNKIIEGLK